MIDKYFKSIVNGNTLIPFNEIKAITRARFAAVESLKTGYLVKINQ